jgi:hypothetical protein
LDLFFEATSKVTFSISLSCHQLPFIIHILLLLMLKCFVRQEHAIVL